jgi:methionine synthase II (cobalamin-independent)
MGPFLSISIEIEIPFRRNSTDPPAKFKYTGPQSEYQRSLKVFNDGLKELIEAMKGMNSQEAAEILNAVKKFLRK